MLEPLINKTASLEASNFIKETQIHALFYEICEFFKNTYFEEHPQTAASENSTEETYCLSRKIIY